MVVKVKDPNEVLDFVVDWSDWLPTGDTISTSAWTVPAGITNDSDTNDTTTTTIWLSGGTLATQYELTNRIVTANGRTKDYTFAIYIDSR